MQAFFTERLTRQRQASPHPIAAYRDALKLLLTFAARHVVWAHCAQPSQHEIAELDAR
jgi:site-specific recombinase XerC